MSLLCSQETRNISTEQYVVASFSKTGRNNLQLFAEGEVIIANIGEYSPRRSRGFANIPR